MGSNVLEILIRAIDQASNVIEGIGKSGTTMSRELETSFIKVGAALTGIGVSCKLMADDINRSFLAFSSAMTEVKALGQLSDAEFEGMRKKALDMSKEMPLAATDIAKAMYQMESVGYSYAESMAAIEPTSKLAVAGSVDLASAMNTVINVMSAYGDQGYDAAKVAEVLAKGVQVGKWELGDFTDEMMRNMNVASALEISFEELCAMNVQLQQSFTSPERAGTALRSVLTTLIDPKAQEKLEKYGITVKDSAGNFRPMKDIMVDLAAGLEDVGGNADRAGYLSETFGERGVTAIIGLARESEKLEGLTQQFSDGGFLADQYGVKIEGTGAKLKIAENKITAAKIALGDAMAPATIAAAGAMGTFAGIIEALPGPLQTVAGTALTFGQSLIAIGPAMMAFPFLMKAIGPATTLVQGAMLGLKATLAGVSTSSLFVTGTMTTLGVSLGALLPIIVGVVAAAVLLYAAWKTNFLGIRDITGQVADWVKERWSGVKDTFASVDDAIAPSVDKLKTALGNLFASVDDLFKKFSGGKSIIEVVKSAFELLGRIIDTLVRKFGSELSRAINGLIDGLTKLVTWVGKVVDWFTKLADNKVVQFFINARDKASGFASTVMDSLFPAIEKTNKELDETPEKLDKTAEGLDKTKTSADKTGQSTSTLTDLMSEFGSTGVGAMNDVAGAAAETEGALAEVAGAFGEAMKGIYEGMAYQNLTMQEIQNATPSQRRQAIMVGGLNKKDSMQALWQTVVDYMNATGEKDWDKAFKDALTSEEQRIYKSLENEYQSSGDLSKSESVNVAEILSNNTKVDTGGKGNTNDSYTNGVSNEILNGDYQNDPDYEGFINAGSSGTQTPNPHGDPKDRVKGNPNNVQVVNGKYLGNWYEEDGGWTTVQLKKDEAKAYADAGVEILGNVDALKDQTDAVEDSTKAQKDAASAVKQSARTFDQAGDSIEKASANTATRSVSSFRSMGSNVGSSMDSTAKGVGSRFDAMGERSVKSSDVMKRNIDDLFDFIEKRSANSKTNVSNDGCGPGGCGFGNDDTGGFNTDTETDYTPYDWSIFPTQKRWDWRLGLPKLAAGARILGSGRVIVGDRGPEMLNLNEGATVVPLTGSERNVGSGVDTRELAKVLREYGGVRDIHLHFQNLIGVPDKNSLRPVAKVLKNLLNEEGNRRYEKRATI